jgi:hypothetical protein
VAPVREAQEATVSGQVVLHRHLRALVRCAQARQNHRFDPEDCSWMAAISRRSVAQARGELHHHSGNVLFRETSAKVAKVAVTSRH